MTGISLSSFGPITGRPINPIDDIFNYRPIVMVEPFVDPPDTFRASRISEMYVIVPPREDFSEFEFDVGLPIPKKSYIFSIQNKTINTVLRCNLTLPPYLRSSLGLVFDVPFIGDTESDILIFSELPLTSTGIPVTTADGFTFFPRTQTRTKVGTNSGTGLVNVVLSFSEAQANTLMAGSFMHEIVFDFFPRDELTGPVYVSTTVQDPPDLNNLDLPPEDVPVDEIPTEEEPEGPEIIEVPVLIETEVPVPSQEPAWISGIDGILRPGSPPDGWITMADGRAYPPPGEVDPCDRENPTGVGGTLTEEEYNNLTPLEKLIEDSKVIPGTFGTETLRRGVILDVDSLMTGTEVERVTNKIPLLIVIDSIPGSNQFKVINASEDYRDGTPIPDRDSDSDAMVYFDLTDAITAYTKEGSLHPAGPLGDLHLREFTISAAVLRYIGGEKINVPDALSISDQQNLRVAATSTATVLELRKNGPGVIWTQAAPSARLRDGVSTSQTTESSTTTTDTTPTQTDTGGSTGGGSTGGFGEFGRFF